MIMKCVCGLLSTGHRAYHNANMQLPHQAVTKDGFQIWKDHLRPAVNIMGCMVNATKCPAKSKPPFFIISVSVCVVFKLCSGFLFFLFKKKSLDFFLFKKKSLEDTLWPILVPISRQKWWWSLGGGWRPKERFVTLIEVSIRDAWRTSWCLLKSACINLSALLDLTGKKFPGVTRNLFKGWLVLLSLLIGWKTGARFLSQWLSVAIAIAVA